ncbi:CoA transferase [Actinomadura sp. KC06]|uniref:CaiB/BaiF CoA transferase family protein n=1 Tax=Actinomadura sp. KC06 TaxID=2530369 RepID=UPI0010517CED|nr:CoA transferase [Actinomadura sp. KC06]TDD40197.1 CoA transferase [Actinomadura sp. KC06]
MSSTPLDGVRVLELGSFIAGPFAGQLLGDYGAEVVKIEPCDGDAMRRWGLMRDGQSLWWAQLARNKRSVAVDLRDPRGRDLVRRLAHKADVVVENFAPGRLAGWGLDYAALSAANPKLIMAHVSGFGQSGPRAHDRGFGSVGEAMGGIRALTGHPDRPPTRVGVSLGDALAGMFAVMGVLAALQERHRSGRGQEIDVALYEAVFALMESSLAEHELAGSTRTRTGSTLPGVAPSNVYRAGDGGELLIAANGDALFARLCAAMDAPDLAADPRFATHQARGQNMAELDALIGDWVGGLPLEEAERLLDEHAVPRGRIYTPADMLADAHYAARDMIVRLADPGTGLEIPMPNVVPKLSRTPGAVRAPGPLLGADTDQVLRDWAGCPEKEIDLLAARGVVRRADATDAAAAADTGDADPRPTSAVRH